MIEKSRKMENAGQKNNNNNTQNRNKNKNLNTTDLVSFLFFYH